MGSSLVGLLVGRDGLQGMTLLPKEEEGVYQALGLLMRIKPEIDALETALREKLNPDSKNKRQRKPRERS